MHMVTAAHVLLRQPDSTPTGGAPITLVMTLVAVVAIVLAASTLTSGIDAYRIAFSAIASLAAAVMRLSVLALLLLALLFLVIVTRGPDRSQAPGSGTTVPAPPVSSVSPVPQAPPVPAPEAGSG